jgi:hypothetical protein
MLLLRKIRAGIGILATPETSQKYVPFQLLDEEVTNHDTMQTQPHNAQEPEALRRSTRGQIPNRALQEYETISDDLVTPDGDIVHLALYVDTQPLTYEQAAKYEEWRRAMEEEIASIEKNKTWSLVHLPANKKPIAVKWIYNSNFTLMAPFQNTKQGWWQKVFYRSLVLISLKFLHQWQELRL